MSPELTNSALPAVEVDAPRVLVSPQVLRPAALSLAGGAAAMWVATQVGTVWTGAYDVVVTVLLYVVLLGVLPLQLLAVTRPLVADVMENSDAPRLMRWVAACAVSTGSLLTALACWQAFLRICGL